MGNCGARVRVSLRLRPVSRVCPGAAAAPALSSSCPRWPGVGPGPRPRAIGLFPRPGPARGASGGSALCGRRGWGRAALSSKAGKKVCGGPAGRAPVGAQAAPGAGPRSDLGPPAGPGRARQAPAGPREPEEGVRGCAPVGPQGPGVEAGTASSGPTTPPPPVALSGLGRREMGAVSAQGPQGRAPRLGGGGRPARSGLLGLPLSGPLQGQPASLGGFRLLPEGSGPGVHHGWGSVADRGLPLGRGAGLQGVPCLL